jgi:hypothetical protein
MGTHRKAMDERDYIYVYLALIQPDKWALIKVDYWKPAIRLYHEVVVMILLGLSKNKLYIFEALSLDGINRDNSYPSWVLNLAA